MGSIGGGTFPTLNGVGASRERALPRELLCGWGAGCAETCLLYPAYKLIFRQQLHGLKVGAAAAQLHSEGPSMLFRGLLPPLMMRALSRAIMFGLYDRFASSCTPSVPTSSTVATGSVRVPLLSPCHGMAAFLAGACEAAMCPLERVQVLLQTDAHHDRFQNTGAAFRSVYREFGIREFYRGYSVIVVRNGLSNILFFGLRTPLRDFLLRESGSVKTGSRRVFAEFVSGAVLGASISTLFFPMNVVKNRIQAQLGGPWERAGAVFRLILSERGGFHKIYHGVQVNIGRSLLAWGITNCVYEALHRRLVEMGF